MSFRYAAGINKPGFNPLAAQTPTYLYNLFAWGSNSSGQLGLGNTVDRSSPVQVGSSNWQSFSSGKAFSGAINLNGQIFLWGNNAYGQLGLGNTTYYSSPKQVGALTNWSKINCGYQFNSAIKTDGTLWAWGRNDRYELGQPATAANISSPVQVGTSTAWLSAACGNYHTVALKTDKTLWAWGSNSQGQIGLGTSTYAVSNPTQVGASTWNYVSAGANWSAAITTDGRLFTWGQNPYGQLGVGNTTYYSSPKQVGALTTWASVSCMCQSGIAVKTDGTLWSWGRNASGEMGIGNTTAYSSPKQVGALTNWLTLKTAHGFTTFCVKTDGTLWGWGQNNNGNIGVGNTTNYSSPKQVGSLSTWLSVAAGYVGTLALG